MRSSRGRAIKPTKAAIADAAARRGKGNGARGSRRGRGAATSSRGGRGTTTAPRGGRGAATAPRGGRGAATAPRGGRGATIASRGGRGPRRLEFVSEEAHENDGVENDDEYDGEEEHEDDREEEHDGERIEEEAEVQLEADGEEEDGDQAIVYLRGPAGLPPLPATDHEKLVIKPTGDFHWIELGGGKRRNPNGVVTVILKECFPGLINFNGRTEPPWTWEHYAAAPDAPDEDGVEYSNCLERVEERFWQYFRWATDPEDTEAEKTKKEHDARRVLRNVIKKRVSQMYYEERKTAVVFYYARVKKEKITRTQACGIRLTETQYMQAIPSWAAPYADCWLQIVRQKWCNDEWIETSNSCKERRSLMSGAAHRQGSSSFPRYKKIMEEKGKRPMSDMAAYVASRHGSENGVLCNGRAQQILERYTEVAKEKHGPDFDVMNAPLDPDVVYKVGCGKKHGRHCLANGYIDSRVSASQSRSSMSCGSFEDIRPSRRLRTGVDRIGDLESQMVEIRQILISLQGQLAQHQIPIANNGIPLAASTAGTPGTAGSIGNNATANPQQEDGDECNDDVVM